MWPISQCVLRCSLLLASNGDLPICPSPARALVIQPSRGEGGQLGELVSGYRVEPVIGRGGMGVVYLAEHVRLKRKVALKVLAPEISEDPRFRDRFVRESELAASLEHPNIVPIYDAGNSDGLLYIAMRYIEGIDLKSIIERDGKLSLDRTASLIAQVADALDAAHAKGLIHRDVKPANILVSAGTGSANLERAYLTDFGVTKRREETTGLTKTGQFMGSVDYAAPEQFQGKPLDARADVYSLGCVTYECLTGDPPFRRRDEAAVMFAHLKEPPPLVTRSRGDLPPSIDEVLAKATAKRPDQRYGSCGDLARALHGVGSISPEPGMVRRWRPKGPFIAAGSILVGLVAVFAWLAVANKGAPEPDPTVSRTTRAGPPPATDLLRIDPVTNEVLSGFELPLDVSETLPLAVGEGFVWAGSPPCTLHKINPASNKLVASIDLRSPKRVCGGYAFGSVATGGGSVWVALAQTGGTTPGMAGFGGGGAVVQVDPKTNRVIRHVDAANATSVVFSNGVVWVTSPAEAMALRIDPASARIVARIEAETAARPSGISAGQNGIWVVGGANGVVSGIDATSNKVHSRIPAEQAVGVVAGESGVWVANGFGGTVTQYDVEGRNLVRVIPIGKGADAIAIGAGSVWVANFRDHQVVRIDPSSGQILARIPAGPCPHQVAASDSAIWVLQLPPGLGCNT